MQRKKMSVIVTITLIIAIAAALAGCTNNTASPTPTPAPSGGDLKSGLPATLDYNIQVNGGSTPVTLSYADLKAMEFRELKGVTTVNSVGTETKGDFVGVPLADIANRGGLPSGDVSFKVTASDGYAITYTKDQLNAGILALKTDGAALNNNINDDKSCIRLVIPGELKNMWLKMPVKVEIVGGAAKPVALSISGDDDKISSRKTYTVDDLRAMTQRTITTTGKNNMTLNYTGVSLNALLDAVGPKGTSVLFISGDANNYNMSISLADIRASADAVIAIDANGQLVNVVPGQPINTRVGNLTRIRIE